MSPTDPSRNSIRVATFLLALFLLAGCRRNRMQAEYVPSRAKFAVGSKPSRLTKLAVVAYENDLSDLEKAGGEKVGWLDLTGKRLNLKAIRKKAANLGATHAVLANSATESSQGPGSSTTDCSSKAIGGKYFSKGRARCTTVSSPGKVTKTRLATYQLMRVPRNRWAELPESLIPSPRSGKRISPNTTPGPRNGVTKLSAQVIPRAPDVPELGATPKEGQDICRRQNGVQSYSMNTAGTRTYRCRIGQVRLFAGIVPSGSQQFTSTKEWRPGSTSVSVREEFVAQLGPYTKETIRDGYRQWLWRGPEENVIVARYEEGATITRRIQTIEAGKASLGASASTP